MGREQDTVGVFQMQALGRLQRLAFQEQRGQYAQRRLIGSAQPTCRGTTLQRVSPKRFGDRVPGDGASHAPVSDFVEHGHMLEIVTTSTALAPKRTFSRTRRCRGQYSRAPSDRTWSGLPTKYGYTDNLRAVVAPTPLLIPLNPNG